jgi:hypothetical protein
MLAIEATKVMGRPLQIVPQIGRLTHGHRQRRRVRKRWEIELHFWEEVKGWENNPTDRLRACIDSALYAHE